MKEGSLPPRPGSVETATVVDFNHSTEKIIVEINGEREELSLADAIGLIGKIAAMIEVAIRNG